MRTWILAALALPLVLGACGAGSAVVSDAPLMRSDAERISEPDAAPDARAAGQTAMALDVLRQLPREGNLAFSPLSLDQAMAMAYAGARGETRAQIAKTMRYGDDVHAAMNAADLALRDRAPNRLDVANAAWGQTRFPLRPEFLEVLAKHYGAGLHATDFKGDPEGARKAIDRWVSGRTRGKIDRLFGESSINTMTRLVLVNALYLKARWGTAFSSSKTATKTFHRPGRPPVRVPFVRGRQAVNAADGEGWTALELPYEGDDLAMLMIVPDRGRFEAFERDVDAEGLQHVLRSLRAGAAIVEFPRFDIASELPLVGPLKRLGVTRAFDNSADLGGIADADLFISDVRQKAVIRTDEAGTEGAAATGAAVEVVSYVPSITVDRPFLFAVRDRPTGQILFLGRVTDPSQASTK